MTKTILTKWAEKTGAKAGDLICILSGNTDKVRAQLSALTNGIGGDD